MIYPLPQTLDIFPSQWNLQYIEEEQHWQVGAEMYGWSETEENIFAVHRSWVIYPLHQFQHLKKGHHVQEDVWESTSCLQRERRRKRVREEKGGGKLFLRHVSLICSPAANENDDQQRDFFSSWLCICPSKPHSWSHTLNKCYLYSIMTTTKKADRTHGPSSHTDLAHKTAGFLPPRSLCVWPDQWPVEHVGSANFITCIWSWCDSLTVKCF